MLSFFRFSLYSHFHTRRSPLQSPAQLVASTLSRANSECSIMLGLILDTYSVVSNCIRLILVDITMRYSSVFTYDRFHIFFVE
jgi:hypothetical protein